MRTAERDEYRVASLVGGLPTCSFAPKTYRRIITSIVVTNTVSSTVNVYRGVLGGVAAATNPLGSNNTLTQQIFIPAGQPFFVQWSAAGSPVSGATARVALEKETDPLAPLGSSGAGWATNAIRSFSVPTVGPPDITLTSDIPAELTAYYAIEVRPVVAVILMRLSAASYTYFAITVHALLGIATHYGLFDAGVVREIYRNNPSSGTPTLTFGSREINAGINVLGKGRILVDVGSTVQIKEWPFVEGNAQLEIFGDMRFDDRNATRAILGSNVVTAVGVAAASVAVGVEVAIPSATYVNEHTFTFRDGFLYRLDLDAVHWFAGGAAVHAANIRVRKGAATIVGQLLMEEYVHHEAGLLGTPTSGRYSTYIKNVSGADITTKLSISIIMTVGAVSMNLWSNGTVTPIVLSLTSLGSATGTGSQGELVSAATAIV